jgi:hypothetical protein
MIINPYKLEIEETNRSLGIKINVSYITIPNEFFAGLARKVTISNMSNRKIPVEIVDGLPQVVPYGMTEWHQKHMSRTVEAWMVVSNLEKGAPFYSLKIDPQDRPELEFIKRGNFYMALEATGNRSKVLRPIVNPDIIFGKNGDISYPRLFVEDKLSMASKMENAEGKTPAAFAHGKFIIFPKQKKEIVSLIGNAKDAASVNMILRKMKNNTAYFEQKLSENQDIIMHLENRIFTKSSSDEFDFYARQTFLDNLLRGGYPISIDTPKGPFVFYAYARKHGDLERDYNAFLLQPSYYSQGNGAYRDINQNRRNDTLFNIDVKDENIYTFVNAIQPDGFNPHLIEGISVSIKNSRTAEAVLKRYIKSPSKRKDVQAFLKKEFAPGEFIFFLEKETKLSRTKRDSLLRETLAISEKKDVIKPGEGYWIDHWTYNMDLLENYFSCYPEKLRELLLGKKDFTFYDTYLRVNPRSEKYVYLDGKIRQYGSVVENGEKKRIIEKSKEPHKLRTNLGKGRIYKTNLLTKLICVIANKMASLDPFGIGIEMEAGKPGWCDGLNGLPGIFGSSTCEVFELKRLIFFIIHSFCRLNLNSDYRILLPAELADFLINLEKLVSKNLSSKSKKRDFIYWDFSSSSKESYRKKVWSGFSGKEKSIPVIELKSIFSKFLPKIERGLKRGFSKENNMPFSYFINDVKKFSFIYENGKKKVNKDNLPLVKVHAFNHRPVSLYLEGPMHAMRVADKDASLSLYRAIKQSGIFDKKLKMYKVNEPLKDMPLEIGRSTIFTPGWLENESIWLHMEYKCLLELLKNGLYEEFFMDFKNCLVAFQPNLRYGRSILENSSFIVSSSYPDENLWGNGFVARLTGTTTEFLTMWLLMTLGKGPFKLDSAGELYFEPEPIIPGWLFTKEESISYFYSKNGVSEKIRLPKNIFAFCLLGKTLTFYHNPKRRNTFGKNCVKPARIILKKKGEPDVKFSGRAIPSPFSLKIREGFYDKIDIELQ